MSNNLNCIKRILPVVLVSGAIGFMFGLVMSGNKYLTVYYRPTSTESHPSLQNSYHANQVRRKDNSIHFEQIPTKNFGPPVTPSRDVSSDLVLPRNNKQVNDVLEKKMTDVPKIVSSVSTLPDISALCTIPDSGGKVLSRDMTTWSINNDACSGNNLVTSKFVRATLRGPQKTPIYVYPQAEDVWVSGNIIRQGMWEGGWVSKIHGILARDNDITFLDLGANVGVFSLTIAKLGRNVIAVDALLGNIQRLCKSVEAGNLRKNIILIHNALSNTREKVALGVYNKNVGGTYVKKLKMNVTEKYVVNSILLDDLLEVFPKLTKVVIKMDVETFEAKVLEGASKFFKEVKVLYLLLEFVSHRKGPTGAFIIKFLKDNNMEPQVGADIIGDYSKWPGEVLFKRIGV